MIPQHKKRVMFTLETGLNDRLADMARKCHTRKSDILTIALHGYLDRLETCDSLAQFVLDQWELEASRHEQGRNE